MSRPGSRPRVLIAGGGITGLTAAYTLESETDFEITLVERRGRLGGVVDTLLRDGFVIEIGPDSLFTAKPDALELIRELGLEGDLVEPKSNGFSVLVDGRLYPVPSGLVGLSGVDPEAVRLADFLSAQGKEQALRPELNPATSAEDQSISDFFALRYGREFSEKVAEPLLAGTHSGDPRQLSVRALFPRLWSGEPPVRSATPAFVSLRNGMESLVDALRKSLWRTKVCQADRLRNFERAGSGLIGWKEEQPERIEADHLLLAIPAKEAAPLVADLEPEAGRLLSSMEFASSVIATVVVNSDQIGCPLHGSGFLVPPSEGGVLKGATWSSQKWADRAPAGTFLLRFFFRDCEQQVIERELRSALQLIGVEGEPKEVIVKRWPDAFPQYTLGHVERVDRIEALLAPYPVSVAGSSYRGVGIPDCIRQGREAAREIARRLL